VWMRTHNITGGATTNRGSIYAVKNLTTRSASGSNPDCPNSMNVLSLDAQTIITVETRLL